MPIVATDSYRLSHLVKAEVLPETAFTREVVTLVKITVAFLIDAAEPLFD